MTLSDYYDRPAVARAAWRHVNAHGLLGRPRTIGRHDRRARVWIRPDSHGHLQSEVCPISDFWVAHMLWPLVWCAAVALLGVGLLWGVRKRTHSNGPDTA